jgi:hypothetical protein
MTYLLGLNGRRGAGKDTAFGFLGDWAAERGVSARRRGFADSLKLSFARIFIPDISLEEAIMWCDELKMDRDLDRTREPALLTIRWGNTDQHGTISTIQHQINGRQALQRYGTEAHRDVFDENFWVDALLPTGNDVQYRPATHAELTIDAYDPGGVYSLPGAPMNLPGYREWRNDRERDGVPVTTPLWPLNFRNPLFPDPPDIAVVTDVRFPNEAERIKALGGQVWEIHRGDESCDTHSSETPLPADLIDRTIYNQHEGEFKLFRNQVYGAAEEEFGK